MRNVLICGLLSGIALLSWLLAGRRFVALLDAVTLVAVDRPAVDRLLYEAGALEIGGKHLDLANPAFARVADVSLKSDGRVFLEYGGRQFALGAGHSLPYMGGLPKFEITPDSGDEVLFIVEQSRVPWPTPFEMNFMTGYAPSAKRNVYLRLRWTKVSRATLEMLWKTEQGYYRRDGWLPPRIESVTDGLIRVSIRHT